MKVNFERSFFLMHVCRSPCTDIKQMQTNLTRMTWLVVGANTSNTQTCMGRCGGVFDFSIFSNVDVSVDCARFVALSNVDFSVDCARWLFSRLCSFKTLTLTFQSIVLACSLFQTLTSQSISARFSSQTLTFQSIALVFWFRLKPFSTFSTFESHAL